MKQLHFALKFFTTIFFLHLSVNTIAQASGSEINPKDKKITIVAKELSIQDIFKSITKQTGLRFSYNNSDVNKNEKITAPFVDMPVDKVLRHIFAGKPISWVYIDNIIRIGKGTNDQGPSMILESQGAKRNVDSMPLVNVMGRVVDTKGLPIAGATVSLKGQGRGQSTDNSGAFSFTNILSNATLVVSSLGFESKLFKLTGQNEVRISLDSMIREIKTVEVMSTGYQNIPKERATGSFVNISKGVYNEQVGTNFLNRLPAIANSVNTLNVRFRNSQIMVRGLSSIAGPKQPLIVVDNFPYEGDLNNINPNDIENINILRDAAAASIWGARAGNGVIVINTKKGRFNEKMQVEVNANVTVAEKPDLFYLKTMATGDFVDVEKFLFDKGQYDFYLNNYPIFFQTDVVDILEKERKNQITPAEATNQLNKLKARDVRRDFEKYMYRSSVNQQYAVNLHGGSSTTAWILTGGLDRNLDELSAKFSRYNFRFENVYKPIERLQLSFGVTYANTQNKSGRTAYGEVPASGGSILPYGIFVDESGNQIPSVVYRRGYLDTVGGGRLLDWKYYPLENYKHAVTTSGLQNIIARAGLKYTLLKGVSVDVKYQLEKQNSSVEKVNDQESFFTRDLINYHSNINYATGNVSRPVPLGGILDMTNQEVTAQNLRGQLNIDQSWRNNAINAIVGGEIRDIKNDSRINRTYGYDGDLLTNKPVDYTVVHPLLDPLFGSGTTPYINIVNRLQNRYVSIFSNVSYTYNDKYTLSLSARRDASNIFGAEANRKWNPLWSVGGAWDISKEGFYNVNFAPYLKLRATYGYSGNVSPTLSSITTIRYSGASIYTNSQIARISNFQNSDLKWEKVGMLNFAVDFSLKNRVVDGTIEYFRKKATDLYGSTPIDRTLGLGVNAVQKNFADMKGQGIDVALNSKNIDRQVTWTSNFIFSYYKDEVVKYYNSSERAENFIGSPTPYVGYPLYSIFTLTSAGLDPLNGDPQGYLNGKISKNYAGMLGDSATIKDLTFHGSAVPTFYGSLGNTIGYKGIALTFRFTYQLGYYFMRESIDYDKLFNQKSGHADFADRWQVTGDEKRTNVPSMRYPADYNRERFYNNSDPLATKGDHIRLQYINLSYTLNKERFSWLPFRDLKVFAVANNVGIIWAANKYGLDPAAALLPAPRNFSFGINAQL